jgi:oxaloacetate decarboxylase gamma subunit
MEIDFVAEGVKFMIIGMTVVFSFLVLMVFAIKVQAWIVNRFFPEKVVEPKAVSSSASSDDASVIAAIMGAVKAFKNKHE